MLKAKRAVLKVFLYFIVRNLLLVTLHAQSGNISGTVTDSSRRGSPSTMEIPVLPGSTVTLDFALSPAGVVCGGYRHGQP